MSQVVKSIMKKLGNKQDKDFAGVDFPVKEKTNG